MIDVLSISTESGCASGVVALHLIAAKLQIISIIMGVFKKEMLILYIIYN
jgi:hypothetical protein